jgi:hypothetical protein
VAKKEPIHYVDNKEFTIAVHEYVQKVNEAKVNDEELPQVTDYIAECFLKICHGLSARPEFMGYSYKEEMVMDGVENCIRYIANYKLEAATRSGKPNAFGYFTQISFYAFVRRIQKENKQRDVKNKYIENMNIEDIMTHIDSGSTIVEQNYMDMLKTKNAEMSSKEEDESLDGTTKIKSKSNKQAKKKKPSQNDLDKFME